MVKVKGITSVSQVVRDIEAAVDWYVEIMDLPRPEITVLERDGVKMATFHLGSTTLSLMEPINNKAGIQRFLEERGEGLHHITLQVDNTQELRERMVDKGLRIIDSHAGEGPMRTFWVHPLSSHFVLMEFGRARE